MNDIIKLPFININGKSIVFDLSAELLDLATTADRNIERVNKMDGIDFRDIVHEEASGSFKLYLKENHELYDLNNADKVYETEINNLHKLLENIIINQFNETELITVSAELLNNVDSKLSGDVIDKCRTGLALMKDDAAMSCFNNAIMFNNDEKFNRIIKDKVKIEHVSSLIKAIILHYYIYKSKPLAKCNGILARLILLWCQHTIHDMVIGKITPSSCFIEDYAWYKEMIEQVEEEIDYINITSYIVKVLRTFISCTYNMLDYSDVASAVRKRNEMIMAVILESKGEV
jgi:hypothetical protein